MVVDEDACERQAAMRRRHQLIWDATPRLPIEVAVGAPGLRSSASSTIVVGLSPHVVTQAHSNGNPERG